MSDDADGFASLSFARALTKFSRATIGRFHDADRVDLGLKEEKKAFRIARRGKKRRSEGRRGAGGAGDDEKQPPPPAIYVDDNDWTTSPLFHAQLASPSQFFPKIRSRVSLARRRVEGMGEKPFAEQPQRERARGRSLPIGGRRRQPQRSIEAERERERERPPSLARSPFSRRLSAGFDREVDLVVPVRPPW